MTRDEHLQWAKGRALEYLEHDDLKNAFTSLLSDLTKHDELNNHPGATLGLMLRVNGHLSTTHEMREWIEGFN